MGDKHVLLGRQEQELKKRKENDNETFLAMNFYLNIGDLIE
jgi:hypothetical protein